MAKYKTYTFAISQELHDKLKSKASDEERSQGAVIRFLLKKYFEGGNHERKS